MNISLALSITFNPHQGFFFFFYTGYFTYNASVLCALNGSSLLLLTLLPSLSHHNFYLFLILRHVVISLVCWVPADPVSGEYFTFLFESYQGTFLNDSFFLSRILSLTVKHNIKAIIRSF